MIINNHILKLSNVIYFKNKFLINNSVINHENTKYIDFSKYIDNYAFINDISFNNIKENHTINNLFVISTLDSCFCHALIDKTFPLFWAKNDIEKYYDNSKEFIYFIKKNEFLEYPNNLNAVENGLYKGIYNDLIHLLCDKYIFEHLIDENYFIYIKDCFFYIKDDKWQRSPWNCVDYYSNRYYDKKNIIYNDNIIRNELNKFADHVKQKYNIENVVSNKNIIVVNRKSMVRNIDNLLPLLNNFFKNFENYKGVVYLEDLTLKEQIEIFTKNKIIISPHGANLIHTIWNKNNTIIEITFNNPDQNKMYKRIGEITNNNLIQVNYQNIILLLNNFSSIYNNIS